MSQGTPAPFRLIRIGQMVDKGQAADKCVVDKRVVDESVVNETDVNKSDKSKIFICGAKATINEITKLCC